MDSESKLWELLFALGGIRRGKPRATLYEVIVDTRDLALAKRFVEGGHPISQRFAGGHSLSLAVKHGDSAFVKYFIENAPDLDKTDTLEGPNDILSAAVERIAQASEEARYESFAVFEYLLALPALRSQFESAFRACAGFQQVTAAEMLIAAGLEDQETCIGPKEYTLLSKDLEARNLGEFATLLRGDAINIEAMKRREAKERKRGAEFAALLGSVTTSKNEATLFDDHFTARYEALTEEIEAGAWTEALSSTDPHDGRSVIAFVAEKGFVELVQVILEINAASANASKEAAIAAATYSEFGVLKLLRSHKVAIHKTYKRKNSPLSEACRYGHLDIVQYLLKLGADPDAGESSGHNFTLDDLAGGPRRGEIIKALVAARAGKFE